MSSGYLIIFGCGLGLIIFLLWMLLPLHNAQARAQTKTEGPRGACPICAQPLYKGERIRSDIVEIGDVEVQTKIKGCPYCMGEHDKRKRSCPVCKKKLAGDAVILALSDPRVDRHKLSIRGCAQCYPQGF